MKFRCAACGAIFYGDESVQVCSLCRGELEEETARQESFYCEGRGVEVELRHGIPVCEYFVLNNASGCRCLYFALPRRCGVACLPEYQPRAGLVRK